MSDLYTVSIISDDNVVSTITVPGGELLENPPEYSSQWLANNKVSKPPHLTRNPFEVSIIKDDFSVKTVTLPGGGHWKTHQNTLLRGSQTTKAQNLLYTS